MSSSLRRRWAVRLARCAASLLPADRTSWGEAMRSEVEHIDDHRAALRWAAGALAAAIAERAGALLNTRMAGGALAFFAFAQALSMFLAPVSIVAYRLRWLRIDEFLGGRFPGGHYQRFIALMNATPDWEVALWTAVGLLYLVLAWRLLRNRRGAFVLFAGALLLAYAVACAGWMDRQLNPALAEIYRHTFTFSQANLRRDDLLPAAAQVLPLLMAGALWWREKRAVRPAA
ncbi:MAG TPA: hypothetical protein VND24_04810 [Steroidobacteraceae bacterium]|nr:hypothetical protein [Steroidobacteraceae bacterium]